MSVPHFEALRGRLSTHPRRWLVTGAAGFIGSNLVEALLRLGQNVAGLDDFSTGSRRNLEEVRRLVGDARWRNLEMIEASVCDLSACQRATNGVDYVLHQAALGSVPRSIEHPLASFAANVDGFLKILTAARDAGASRFVYASSSSVFGDSPALPKVEDRIGKPLSPYAATKYVDEVFADVWARTYGMRCIGLRYFNVFGPRQDPNGAYAAVVPRWAASLLRGETVHINGDGKTSRDFCYVDNAVQANLLAAAGPDLPTGHEVFNVACGEQTTLDELFVAIRIKLGRHRPAVLNAQPSYREFRAGDVRHSLADISKARNLLGYEPSHRLGAGLETSMQWYLQNSA